MNLQKTITNLQKSRYSFFNINEEVWVNLDLFKRDCKYRFYLDVNKIEYSECKIDNTNNLIESFYGTVLYKKMDDYPLTHIYISKNKIDYDFMRKHGLDYFLVLGK